MKYLQNIGKSLMVPVAVLPAAALLLGIGYLIDPTGWGGNSPVATFFIASGGALIENMGILFAIGVAYGMSKDKNGAAALTALVGWLIVQRLLDPATVQNLMNLETVEEVAPAFSKVNNQFIGILIGVISAHVYNATYQVKLPVALSFFSGRRLSAIVNSFVMILLSTVLFFVWPLLFKVLTSFGIAIQSLGAVGAGLFGFFNRLLIPIGMHHALNSVFWFDVIGINDIPNYLDRTGEVGTVGIYQAGFFPIMMFGLVGAALAIVKAAHKENRARIAGIMLSAAVAAFVTGVTEPLEFSFLFVAPVLYLIHAVLTGISLFIAASFEWIAGFGFSAGAIDYVLSFTNEMAVNNFMLIIQGLVFFVIYYFVFYFAIIKFNLKTPGRGESLENEVNSNITVGEKAQKLYDIIGNQLEDIDNCATRLRLTVTDSESLDEQAIKALGFTGVLKPGKSSLQIIVGPDVQFIADELNELHKKK